MGLFSFIVQKNTKDSTRVIRGGLKDSVHFERILKKEQEIIQGRNELIAKKESDKENRDTYLYYAIANNYINIIKIRYSMGDDIKELKDIYMNSLKYFLLGFEAEEPMYFDMLNCVALAILLNVPIDNFKQLVNYMQQMDEQANPADWTPDLLLWYLLNSRLKDNNKKHVQKLAFPKLYKDLYKLTKASDDETAKKGLKKYISKWYNLNKDAPWYNNHLRGAYRGYGAWEVAAVAKVMHIDDTDLKDNPYYPYDMVHWEDCEESKER